MKLKDIAINIVMALVMVFIITSNLSSANNHTNIYFDFLIYQGYGNQTDGPANKLDTSKVYFKNKSNSSAQIELSILGAGNSNTYTDCTYNINNGGNGIHYPFTVPVNHTDYYSSTVYETYGTQAKAKVQCAAAFGSYHTVWSPDNINGY